MQMTEELAKRVVGRTAARIAPISEKMQVDVLMDWLEGMTYKELAVKHKLSRGRIGGIITTAKKQARELVPNG